MKIERADKSVFERPEKPSEESRVLNFLSMVPLDNWSDTSDPERLSRAEIEYTTEFEFHTGPIQLSIGFRFLERKSPQDQGPDYAFILKARTLEEDSVLVFEYQIDEHEKSEEFKQANQLMGKIRRHMAEKRKLEEEKRRGEAKKALFGIIDLVSPKSNG